jgi:hypothetical protein
MRGPMLQSPQPLNLILTQVLRLNVCDTMGGSLRPRCTLLTILPIDLLAPLTAASDLPDHPTLSKPFTSKTLTELTRQAADMVHKERASLWSIKHLLTRLSGDHSWVPCEVVEAEHDLDLFGDDQGSRFGKSTVKEDADRISASTSISEEAVQEAEMLLAEAERPVEGARETGKATTETPILHDDSATVTNTSMDNVDATGDEENDQSAVAGAGGLKNQKESTNTPAEGEVDGVAAAEDIMTDSAPQGPDEDQDNQDADETEPTNADEGAEEENSAPRRMRTRAQAQVASENTATSRSGSATPDSGSEPLIHPYFLAPESSRPDRDLGLPKHEAEETRRLLQLYIQKQEEVCRGAQRVYDGLLKADRYRHMVMKWAKAEGHVGHNRDMSDGEDWYDKEEWGLEEDLKKGQDEEEEDATTTAKKTRTRRQ